MESWFSELTNDQRSEILACGRKVQCSRGEEIFGQGEEARGFYIIEQGSVEIYKISTEGKEQLLHIFSVGEPIGEVAVFAGEPVFPACARAVSETILYFVGKADFLQLLAGMPQLSLAMLGILSRRLHRFGQIIEDLSLKEVSARLAQYLLNLHKQQEGVYLQLDIAKGQLASRLGTVAETLSRTLKRLVDQGIIDMDHRTIKILDIQRLKRLAQGKKL